MVTARIVHQFELIQIHVTENKLPRMVLHRMQSGGHADFHLAAVVKPGQMIAFCLPGQPLHQSATFGFILKNQHPALHLPGRGTYRRRRIANRHSRPVRARNSGVVIQRNHLVASQGQLYRTGDRRPAFFVHHRDRVCHLSPQCIPQLQAGQLQCARIDKFNAARCIGDDDSIADGFDGDAQTFFFVV